MLQSIEMAILQFLQSLLMIENLSNDNIYNLV